MKSVKNLAKQIFSIPTAPYRETWVLNEIQRELKRLKVPHFKDSWGNMIAGEKSARNLKHSEKIALIAHTDHPGFHIEKQLSSKTFKAKWYGGCPPRIKNAKVHIYIPTNPQKVINAKIKNRELEKDRTFILTIAKSDLKSISLIDDQCFGTFAFPDFKMKRSLIFARAADDLAGVVAILATFERLNTSQRKNMLAVFTRAEETGFRGALGFLYSQILGAKNMAISLEASRALEGAEISQGPVIRLGDRRSLFNSDVVSRLDFAAESLKKRGKKIQRRIMDGGVCEGTAFNFLGIKCGGLAIPLGNYHNQKPSGKPGPEFVCLNDLITEVDLCVEFYKNCEKKINPVKKYLTELEAGFKKDSSLLKRKISFKGRT